MNVKLNVDEHVDVDVDLKLWRCVRRQRPSGRQLPNEEKTTAQESSLPIVMTPPKIEMVHRTALRLEPKWRGYAKQCTE